MLKKGPVLYGTVLADTNTILDAEGLSHREQKRAVVSAFSQRGLLSQESILIPYIHEAADDLKSRCLSGDTTGVDFLTWFSN